MPRAFTEADDLVLAGLRIAQTPGVLITRAQRLALPRRSLVGG